MISVIAHWIFVLINITRFFNITLGCGAFAAAYIVGRSIYCLMFNLKKEKEEVVCPREGVPTSGSSNFTLRNSQSVANPTSTRPHSIPLFSIPPPPLFTPPFIPLFQTPQYCQMPAANWGFCGGCQCWGPVIPILAVH